jgi:hypothetical protein
MVALMLLLPVHNQEQSPEMFFGQADAVETLVFFADLF